MLFQFRRRIWWFQTEPAGEKYYPSTFISKHAGAAWRAQKRFGARETEEWSSFPAVRVCVYLPKELMSWQQLLVSLGARACAQTCMIVRLAEAHLTSASNFQPGSNKRPSPRTPAAVGECVFRLLLESRAVGGASRHLCVSLRSLGEGSYLPASNHQQSVRVCQRLQSSILEAGWFEALHVL